MTVTTAPMPPLGSALRRLYLLRFAVAIVWAAGLVAGATRGGPLLAVLLVLYPLIDVAAVAWQLRAGGRGTSPRIAEWLNIALSAAAAIGLGIASSVSLTAVVTVWGVWAVVSGVTQLVTALLRRRTGGQVPLVVSGGLSVLAGAAFVTMGAQGAASATNLAGYAVLGGIFFLIAAIRLGVALRTTSDDPAGH